MGRFRPVGNSKVVAAASISSLSAPTQAELNAGTVLCAPGSFLAEGLQSINGLSLEPSQIDLPDIATDFTTQIGGRTPGKPLVLKFYDDDSSSTIKTALAKNTTTNICVMRYGQTTGKRIEVYPVRVISLNYDDIDAGQNVGAMYTVTAVPTAFPSQTGVIAA